MATRVTDYYNRYKTPAEKLMAAQSMLRASTYGRGNIIRADLDGDNVVFISSVTGKVHANLDSAVREVQPLNLTELTSVSSVRAKMVNRGRSFAGNKTSAAAAMFSSVINQLGAIGSQDLQLLRDAGIDVDELVKNGNMDILTMHARKGESNAKQIAERIRVMRERGSLHGLTVVDDEGGRVVQFRAGKNLLNSYQTNLLLSVTGHDMLDSQRFTDILKSGSTSDLSKALMKIPKRARAFLAEREVSLAGSELSRFIGKNAKNLNEAFLYVDPQFDLLKKLAGQNLKRDLDIYYAKADPTEFLSKYMSDIDSNGLKDRINSLITKGVGNSKDLFNELIKSIENDPKLKNIADREKIIKQQVRLVEQIFKTIEYGFDGSDVLNSRHLKNYRNSLQSERNRLEGRIASLTGDAKKQAIQQVAEIDQQLKSIDLGLKHGDQITGRGRIAGRGDVKTAFHITDLDPRLNKYAGIISKFSLKDDLGLMGDQESLILGGFGDLADDILQGRSRGLVYADPVLTAFQPEYFADLETQQAIRGRINSIISEFQSSIDNNVLPQRLKAMLEKSASEDVDMIAPHLRYSALRNREYARQILELHRSGVGPRQSPKMMNLLASMMASQAFREKDGFVQAVLPDVYRFAIDTEAISYGSKNINPILGTGYEKIGGIKDINNGLLIKHEKTKGVYEPFEAVKFRVKGHKMMFAPGVVGDVRHALGGFDLDDKGLPKISTFEDDKGIRRLGFNIFRQPSGPEEVIFGRMSMDFETIQALFSGDQFTNALDELISENAPGADRFRALKHVLGSDLKDRLLAEDPEMRRVYGMYSGTPKNIQAIPDDIEQAIIGVYERLQAKGLTRVSDLSKKFNVLDRMKKFGATSLRIEDVLEDDAKYTRQGIYKIMSENGAFSLADEMMSALEANKDNIKASSYSRMKNILQSSGGDFGLAMQELSKFFPGDPSARAIFSMAFQESARAAQESGADILGLYVNRSMAVGSFLNQYEDILGNLQISNQKAGKFLLENFQIGLLAQESAIDYAINFSASRQMNAAIGSAIAESGFSLNVKGVEAAVNQITGQMGSLDDVGRKAISSLGKIIGGVGTLDEVKDIGAGLDSILLNTRIKGEDLKILLEGMISGAEEMQKAGLATADSTLVQNRIAEMKSVLKNKNEQDIRDYLSRTIGLVRGNKYASLANVDASNAQEMFDAVRRSAIGRIGRDETLSNFVANSETQAAAKAIMDKHADLMENIYNRVDSVAASLSEEEIMEKVGALQYHGRAVLDDMAEAVKVRGVSMMDLVNEIDRLSHGRRFRLENLSAVFNEANPDNAFELSKRIMDIKSIRRANYYSRMDDLSGGVGSAVESRLNFMLGGDFEADRLDKQAAQLLKTLRPTGMYDQSVEEVLLSMVGRSEEIADAASRAEADRVATLIRSRANVRGIDPGIIDDLTTAGVIDDLSQVADDSFLKDIFQTMDDEAEGIGTVRERAYKRIGDKLKEDDFRRFLKSAPIRNTGLAIGALVLGSFAYSSYKDRTHADMQGPPLLPGGSAYEEDYPFRIPEIGSFSGQGYSPGMSYQVSVNGSRDDLDRFNSEIGGLTNASINTTMYDRAPDFSRNPLRSIMEAF